MDLFSQAWDYYRTPPGLRKPEQLEDWTLSRLAGRSRTERIRSIRDGEIDREWGYRPLPIHFLGVWDTVGSLGVPGATDRVASARVMGFHDTTLAANVSNAYQALALHELREDFKPDFWTEKAYDAQFVQQVWFPGAHSDVGGGTKDHRGNPVTSLSSGPLEWMIRKATDCGLAFEESNEPGDPAAPISRPWAEGFWTVRNRYVRPIGAGVTDDVKPTSLNESRHESAAAHHRRRYSRWRGYEGGLEALRVAAERSFRLPEYDPNRG